MNLLRTQHRLFFNIRNKLFFLIFTTRKHLQKFVKQPLTGHCNRKLVPKKPLKPLERDLIVSRREYSLQRNFHWLASVSKSTVHQHRQTGVNNKQRCSNGNFEIINRYIEKQKHQLREYTFLFGHLQPCRKPPCLERMLGRACKLQSTKNFNGKTDGASWKLSQNLNLEPSVFAQS